MAAEYSMSSTQRDPRLIELVAAFTEMGPAWMRWVQGAIPDDTVSYARLRVLNALECHPDGLTMTKLAEALEVTGRRVTALVDALTEAGRAQQRQVWEEHQGRVAVAFGDLSDEDQVRLLDISHKLTAAFRRRLAERAAPVQPACGGDPDAVLIRNNRRVRPPRPQSS